MIALRSGRPCATARGTQSMFAMRRLTQATSRGRGLAYKRLPRRPFDLFVDRLTAGGMKAKLVTRSN